MLSHIYTCSPQICLGPVKTQGRQMRLTAVEHCHCVYTYHLNVYTGITSWLVHCGWYHCQSMCIGAGTNCEYDTAAILIGYALYTTQLVVLVRSFYAKVKL